MLQNSLEESRFPNSRRKKLIVGQRKGLKVMAQIWHGPNVTSKEIKSENADTYMRKIFTPL